MPTPSHTFDRHPKFRHRPLPLIPLSLGVQLSNGRTAKHETRNLRVPVPAKLSAKSKASNDDSEPCDEARTPGHLQKPKRRESSGLIAKHFLLEQRELPKGGSIERHLQHLQWHLQANSQGQA